MNVMFVNFAITCVDLVRVMLLGLCTNVSKCSSLMNW